MMASKVPPGHVRALVERPSDGDLIAAANELLNGGDPTQIMLHYAGGRGKVPNELEIDPTFGAVPIGRGSQYDGIEDLQAFLTPGKSDRFLVSGFVDVSTGRRGQGYFEEGGQRYQIYSNPLVGGLLSPCLPTCGSSKPVGTALTVQTKLDVPTLQANRLDGTGVAIAIVDSGIYKPRIELLLGQAAVFNPPTAVNLNVQNSWTPNGLVTKPGRHRLGHGTMCAYDALIAAPNATLLDFPMLLARPVADHHSTSMVDAAVLAYQKLASIWSNPAKPFDALVVSNSWGLFHPCLEDAQPGDPNRFMDNPLHPFHSLVRSLAAAGVDIIFCGNNCGNDTNCAGTCASGTCLSKTDRMIMGANTYEEVLTVGGCDTNDQMVGYSSRGPSIAGMYQKKPDLVAYTHFLGSKVVGMHLPDTGVSAACPVAAGCVAALRTQFKPSVVAPSKLFKKLRDTAYKPPVGGPWPRTDFGHGVIRPVDAYRQLP
jgi:hypothetical protein